MKTVDYATRSVISAVRINSNKPSEQLVKFGYTGIPLSHLCNLFYPFFVYEIKSWAEELFTTVTKFKYLNTKTGKEELVELYHPMDSFTPEKIKKMLSLYIKSPENRTDLIYIQGISNKTGKPFDISLDVFQNELRRPFTLLDLIYIVANRVCEDKHVYVTRYPVNNYQNIYPSRIKIISTYQTCKMELANKYFDNYPYILYDRPNTKFNRVQYIDTVLPHHSYLKALGGEN